MAIPQQRLDRFASTNPSLQDILDRLVQQGRNLTESDARRGNTTLSGRLRDLSSKFAVASGPGGSQAIQAGLAQLLDSLLRGGMPVQQFLNEQLRASDRGTQSALFDAEERSARTGSVGPGGVTAAAIGEAGLRRNSAIEAQERDKAEQRLSQRLALLGDLAIRPGLQSGQIATGRDVGFSGQASQSQQILGAAGQGIGLAGQLGLFGPVGVAAGAAAGPVFQSLAGPNNPQGILGPFPT